MVHPRDHKTDRAIEHRQLLNYFYAIKPQLNLNPDSSYALVSTLAADLGNTVIVVEHDEDAILTADHVVDIGPKAGIHGGEIVAEGTPEDVADVERSYTGQYLRPLLKPRKKLSA